MLSKIKQFLPGSSRSLHAMHNDIQILRDDIIRFQQETQEQIERLYKRVETADNGINMNIDYKFDCRTIPMIEAIANDIDAHDEHMKMFAWDNYRKPGESIQDAKKRFFRELPKAEGGLRLLQLGCGKLLGEFDALCKDNNIDYWINFGTLIGAIRHKGFIPWDDDTDLGIMRDDLERLQEIVRSDRRYKITVVYDHYVHCRQIRFLYNDEDIPCFLDLFIYDWAPSIDNDYAEKQRELRRTMVEEMETDSELDFWKNEPYYSGEKNCNIQKHFDSCLERSKEAGLICDKKDAVGIMWSIDNLDDGKQRQWVYPIEDLYPTQQIKFEGEQLKAPCNPDIFLWSCYGNIYDLPKDINTHFEHVNHDDLECGNANNAIRKLIASD